MPNNVAREDQVVYRSDGQRRVLRGYITLEPNFVCVKRRDGHTIRVNINAVVTVEINHQEQEQEHGEAART